MSDVFQHYADTVIRHLDDAAIDDFRNRSQGLLNDLYTAENMDFTPVGTVAWFPGPTIPDKWVKCTGQTLYESDYPELYAALPDFQFVEVGTGFDIVILPDLTNRFLYGANNDGEIGDTGGATTHTLTIAEMPAHDHAQRQQTAGGGVTAIAPTANRLNTIANTIPTTGSTGGGGAHNNMPPFIRGYWMIKALP